MKSGLNGNMLNRFLASISSDLHSVHTIMSPPLFPVQTPDYILSFQFSSWYPTFSSISIKSTVIRPLDEAFKEYLNSDGVFVPEGSDNASVAYPFCLPQLYSYQSL
jgi:hypothetical protein